MDEFDLIARYFSGHDKDDGVVVGVGDDGALLAPTPGVMQVQVIDTIVEHVHFPASIGPEDIGYRVVAVNVSDIAAMGATPRWMTLALTLSGQDEQWVAAFARGLFAAAAPWNIALVGGDTTSGSTMVATVHMTGEVEADKALLRSGARPGDTVFVTGTVGDAAAGLSLIESGDDDSELVARFLRPTPRVSTGLLLAGRASAAIDVSDGLAGDLAKLLAASGVGADIDIERIPQSAALRARFTPADCERFALTGGDDYELCFTANPARVAGVPGVTPIGVVTETAGLVCRRDGRIVDVDDAGYRHFA